jgi:hypothetical protein
MDKERLRDECNEIIVELSNTDAECFMESTIEPLPNRPVSKKYLEELKNRLLYIKDQYAFAVILKCVLISIITEFKTLISKKYDYEKVKNTVERDFYRRNKKFIEQTWYWVVYWNLWYFIQFLANIFLAFTVSRN